MPHLAANAAGARRTVRVLYGRSLVMPSAKSVWGIDIGQCALKALKLSEENGELQVGALEVIEYPKILSQPDADRDQLIREALKEFLGRNDLRNTRIVVGVPGQTSFTRFVKMPPVEPKKIPDLIRFEAEQQIPFDINEVIWRWQPFEDPDNPELEVGLFAIKRTDVYGVLEPFVAASIEVDMVQMAPLALYNFLMYDEQVAGEGATLLVDVGADSTDLVVADGPRLWTRTIQLGGNAFTEALVKAFKLSFAKAEKLKRAAGTSKYARQIFQAMRPVFADLTQEIQRSIGYYTSLHRQSRFSRIVGLGNGFRLPGLQKYLEQNLNTPVTRLDAFNELHPSEEVSGPTFTENVLGLGVAYGLAAQGLGVTRVETNLLPGEITAQQRWARKRPWFAAAAVLLIVAAIAPTVRAIRDNRVLRQQQQAGALRLSADVRSTYQDLLRQYDEIAQADPLVEEDAKGLLKVQGYYKFWPEVMKGLSEALRKANLNPEKLMVYDKLDPSLRYVLGSDKPIGRDCIIITDIAEPIYIPDLSAKDATLLSPERISSVPVYDTRQPVGGATGDAGTGPQGRGFLIVLTGWCPRPRSEAPRLLTRLADAMRGLTQFESFETVNAEFVQFLSWDAKYQPPPETVEAPGPVRDRPGAEAGAEPKEPEEPTGPTDVTGQPIRPKTHTRFKFGWIVKITGDGVTPDEPAESTEY